MDRRSAGVFMPEQLPSGPDVVTGFEQMGGEGGAEGAAADAFDDSGFADGFLYRPLEDCFVHMVPPLLTCLPIFPAVLLWEDLLPAQFGGRVRGFAVEGVRQLDAPPAFFEVVLVDHPDLCQVFL